MVADPADAQRRAQRPAATASTIVRDPDRRLVAARLGPIFVLDGAGGRAGVDFGFNAWGEKFEP